MKARVIEAALSTGCSRIGDPISTRNGKIPFRILELAIEKIVCRGIEYEMLTGVVEHFGVDRLGRNFATYVQDCIW